MCIGECIEPRRDLELKYNYLNVYGCKRICDGINFLRVTATAVRNESFSSLAMRHYGTGRLAMPCKLPVYSDLHNLRKHMIKTQMKCMAENRPEMRDRHMNFFPDVMVTSCPVCARVHLLMHPGPRED